MRDRPRAVRRQTADHPDEARLAAAGRADQAHELAGLHAEVHVAQRHVGGTAPLGILFAHRDDVDRRTRLNCCHLGSLWLVRTVALACLAKLSSTHWAIGTVAGSEPAALYSCCCWSISAGSRIVPSGRHWRRADSRTPSPSRPCRPAGSTASASVDDGVVVGRSLNQANESSSALLKATARSLFLLSHSLVAKMLSS